MKAYTTTEAPAGATHRHAVQRYWLKFDGKDLYFWRDRLGWVGLVLHKKTPAEFLKEETVALQAEWAGTCTPPVGTAVECKCTAKNKVRDWFAAEVMYVSEYTVVLRYYSTEELDGEFVAHPATLVFRARRTPEQIAAEERNTAIGEMLKGLSGTATHGDIAYRTCAQLYDAGYRLADRP